MQKWNIFDQKHLVPKTLLPWFYQVLIHNETVFSQNSKSNNAHTGTNDPDAWNDSNEKLSRFDVNNSLTN